VVAKGAAPFAVAVEAVPAAVAAAGISRSNGNGNQQMKQQHWRLNSKKIIKQLNFT